ncbi:MAG: hypothetical protein DMF61_25085 [Blastocatellia bacterium AA13]|nr:MAG: hypothetical protein DMF61_25085 [Blastocatellia bacterium AA13]
MIKPSTVSLLNGQTPAINVEQRVRPGSVREKVYMVCAELSRRSAFTAGFLSESFRAKAR